MDQIAMWNEDSNNMMDNLDLMNVYKISHAPKTE